MRKVKQVLAALLSAVLVLNSMTLPAKAAPSTDTAVTASNVVQVTDYANQLKN